MTHTYLESHGVLLDVEIQDAEIADQVRRILPPGWKPSDQFPEDGHFVITPTGNGTYEVYAEELPVASGVTADIAVHTLDVQIRARIALLARDRIFVHAGVVALGGRALILPGRSFTGKSTLVAALVKAGATYYSDEFAVLDLAGNVHPYPRPLSLRPDGDRYGDYVDVADLGGVAGSEPVRPGLIAVTYYAGGSRWNVQPRDAGFGALSLLTHAVPAQERVREAMRATTAAARHARVLEGERADADAAAQALLREMGAA
jgi:hypothetical protein